MRTLTCKKGFVSLVGILITIIIIAISFFLMLKIYIKGPSVKKETAEIMEEAEIDASDYKGALEGTKNKIDDLNKQSADRAGQYEKYFE